MKKYTQRIQEIIGRSQLSLVSVAALGLCFGGSAWADSVQPTFPSAVEAAQSLFHAVQNNDESAIAKMLGGPTDLTTSTDPGHDKADRDLFVQKYQQMHRLAHDPDGSLTLYIGAENWPFPVPLVSENGAWRFDLAAGKMEVLFRRIGENELAAIVACEEFAASEPHPTQTSSDLTRSTAGSLVTSVARASATANPILLNGYYFRVVAPQKRVSGAKATFFLIAYPAEYRSSGVMTFVAAKDGAVYEKDLGTDTSQLAGTMAAFHKDATWQVAGD